MISVLQYSELLLAVFEFLSPKELLELTLVNKLFDCTASSDVLWRRHVEKLWSDKVYIAPHIRILTQSSFKVAYLASIVDSKRTFITKKELNTGIWSFRFKEAAGEDWTRLCPWNQGLTASTVRFHENGRLERIRASDYDDGIAFLYEGMTLKYEIKMRSRKRQDLSRLVQFQKLRRLGNSNSSASGSGSSTRNDGEDNTTKEDSVNNSEDAIARNIGDVVLLMLNGVQVPTYHVKRSPTGNWGFVLESCWAVYTSWPMPNKGECVAMHDENLTVTIHSYSQRQEVKTYNEILASLAF